MKNINYIGVDPGSSPAICILDKDGEIINLTLIKGTPLFPYKKYGQYCNEYVSENDIVFIEDVHSIHQSSAKSNFSFGRGVGASAMGMWFVEDSNYVQPKVWQKELWIEVDKPLNLKGPEKSKSTSLTAAKRIMGDKWIDTLFLPTKKSYVVNHNMVDAYLIALYGYTQRQK